MRRDAVGQVEERAEEVELGLAEAFDIGLAVGAPDGGTNGEDENIEQRVKLAALQTGIGKTHKERCKKGPWSWQKASITSGVEFRHPEYCSQHP